MRNLYVFIILCFLCNSSQAQCPANYTNHILDWDYADFMVSDGDYNGYVSLAQAQTQRFAFGTQRLTITHNYTAGNNKGDNTSNTGETGSYGTGADVNFSGDGTITLTFDVAVQNVKFSIYDIDRNQRIQFGATDGATARNISLTRLGGGSSVLSISNNNATNARVDASNTSVNNTDNFGTVNVDITGPVTTITLNVSNTGQSPDFWLGDITACTTGSYTNNYYNISRPFTGQPAYVLASRNDSIYYVNVANGASKFLFADYGHDRINSMAYDPYRHLVYYTYSLSGPGGVINPNERALRRYDYENNTLSVVTTDVRTLGIPLFDQGVESGGASFYDGKLYLGIEGGTSANRESVIWRIDFNGSYVPQNPASQLWAVEGTTHDWSDFGMNDGVLYDFDGDAGNGFQEDFYVMNMATGVNTNYKPNPTNLVPRQTGVDWNGNVYNIGSSNAIAAATIQMYNKTSGVTGAINNVTFNGTAEVGSWGDAGEAFKPKTDFGDAPASYDPSGVDPATHEIVSNLRLGNAVGIEFAKKTSANATGDGSEEDGITGTPAIGTLISNFTLPVSVFNNTGTAATVAGWIDRNGNGVYEAIEGTTATVPSSATQQTVNLIWNNINVTLPPGTTTFLRLRITTGTMTTANMTGYYENGEVEDHVINVTFVLPDHKISLDAQKTNNDKVNLTWKVNHEDGYKTYELQKSKDGSTDWNDINTRPASGSLTAINFSFMDPSPIKPVSYYRVKITGNTGAITYTNIKKVDFGTSNSMTISPNPANSYAVVNIHAAKAGSTQLNIIDFSGRTVHSENLKLVAGSNDIRLPVIQKLSDGIYKVRVMVDKQVMVSSLVVIK
jgi:hypothetical protein